MRNSIISLDKGNSSDRGGSRWIEVDRGGSRWIEVIIVRPNFHVDISEQVTIRQCMRSSFEGSVNMDL